MNLSGLNGRFFAPLDGIFVRGGVKKVEKVYILVYENLKKGANVHVEAVVDSIECCLPVGVLRR